VIEDILVKINELVFPADFVILDMAEDEEMPLILGRPFLATGRALIDVERGQLELRFHKEQVVLNIFEAMKHRAGNPKCYQIDVVEEIVEENSRKQQPTQPLEQTIVNSIEDDEGIEDMEVKECIKQLEANEQLSHFTRDENIFSEEKEEQQSSKKIPELQELPSHLKYVFLSDDQSRPAIISSTLTPL
jgi:hypothetical protein